MTKTAGMARALGGWIVLGAVLMACVASAIVTKQPFRVDEPGDLAGMFVLLGGWLTVYFVLAALVVADAVRLARRGAVDVLQRAANHVKLISIPFFLLNFVALAEVVAVFGADDRDRFGLGGVLVAVLFIALTYLLFLPTSAYAVACLVVLRRDGRIGRTFFGLNLTCQFLYVVDVLSAILVVEVARHHLGIARPPKALARNLLTGVLALGSLLASVWFVLLAIYYLLDQSAAAVRDAIFLLNLVPVAEFVLLVLIPVVPVVTLRTAAVYYLAGDLDALCRSARAVKLALIPLFLQTFALCMFIVLAVTTIVSVYGSRGQLDPTAPDGLAIIGAFTSAGLLPAAFCAYLMLLPTSIYGLTCLALMKRQQAISPRFCALNVLLHLLFVADVISALVVSRRAPATPVQEGLTKPKGRPSCCSTGPYGYRGVGYLLPKTCSSVMSVNEHPP